MQVCSTVHELRTRLDEGRASGQHVGVVPTMGYLHSGHRSLMDRARNDNEIVVATIFVNPLQFGANEDFSVYPRDLARDSALAEDAGVDVLFVPGVEEMYPDGVVMTSVDVPELGSVLEGRFRPTHFRGVATVVAKLFNLVGTATAYFGEKDFQQLAIIRQLAKDLSFPVSIVGCPTVRDHDGLALSSRNQYLSAAQRAQASGLFRALSAGADQCAEGEPDPRAIEATMVAVMDEVDHDGIDYLAIVDSQTLGDLDVIADPSKVRLLSAVRFGATRLIDNMGVAQDARGVFCD